MAGLVCGVPLGPLGDETERSQLARDAGAEAGRILGLPVYFVDERYSTRRIMSADRETGRSEKEGRADIDARAAAEILQGFLDSRRLSVAEGARQGGGTLGEGGGSDGGNQE